MKKPALLFAVCCLGSKAEEKPESREEKPCIRLPTYSDRIEVPKTRRPKGKTGHRPPRPRHRTPPFIQGCAAPRATRLPCIPWRQQKQKCYSHTLVASAAVTLSASTTPVAFPWDFLHAWHCIARHTTCKTLASEGIRRVARFSVFTVPTATAVGVFLNRPVKTCLAQARSKITIMPLGCIRVPDAELMLF